MMRALAVLSLLAFQDADRVAPLARNFDSADLRKIYHAVGDLAALGEPALPAIEARAKVAHGRARDYLQLAAEEIRAARMLTGIAPAKRITMKASDRNVIELLGDLRSRTGVALTLENLMGEERLPEIPVDIQDATMLEAFDAICRAGNVGVLMENGQFMLYQGDYQDVPRFFYDHYFFRLQNFVLMKSVDFRKPAVQSFKLQMEMLWDPAAAPCRFSAPVLLEVLDDKGKSLKPPPREEPKEKPAHPEDEEEEGEPGATSFLQLVPPAPGAEKIAVLRGYAAIGLPKTRVTLTFADDPARKPEPKPADAEPDGGPIEGLVRKSGDFTVKIAKIDPALSRIACEISSKTLKPEDIAKMPFQANVILKGGEPTRAFVSPWSLKENVAEVMVSFQPLHLKEILIQPDGDRPPPPPVLEKIELSIVTAVQERKIPFEFRDVKIR